MSNEDLRLVGWSAIREQRFYHQIKLSVIVHEVRDQGVNKCPGENSI
jgi:hypothetical protein